ncbi:unnamed protein product, partial [Polarella glacialis]
SRPCWPDRAAADLFLARVLRGGDVDKGSNGGLDFPRFLRQFVQPLGEVLVGATSSKAEAVEAFVERVLPAISFAGPFVEGRSEE